MTDGCVEDQNACKCTATCNFPPRIPRLKLVAGDQESFLKQGTVRYVCEDRFTPLSGSGNATCDLGSQWSAPSLYCTGAWHRE